MGRGWRSACPQVHQGVSLEKRGLRAGPGGAVCAERHKCPTLQAAAELCPGHLGEEKTSISLKFPSRASALIRGESHRQEAPKGAGVQGRGGSPCTWPSSSCLLVSHSSDSAHPCSAASVAWEESSLDSVRFPFPTVKGWFPSLWSRAASLWWPW